VVAQCSGTCPTANIHQRAIHSPEGSPWNPPSPCLQLSPAA
jgi:hypothetical protein